MSARLFTLEPSAPLHAGRGVWGKESTLQQHVRFWPAASHAHSQVADKKISWNYKRCLAIPGGPPCCKEIRLLLGCAHRVLCPPGALPGHSNKPTHPPAARIGPCPSQDCEHRAMIWAVLSRLLSSTPLRSPAPPRPAAEQGFTTSPLASQVRAQAASIACTFAARLSARRHMCASPSRSPPPSVHPSLPA